MDQPSVQAGQPTQTVSEQQIDLLRSEIAELKKKTTPDAIAKSVDSSYLSINNLRAFLQILALIFTVFLAGAIYFATVGLTNIFKIREEAEKVQAMRESVSQSLEYAKNTQQQIEMEANGIKGSLTKTMEAFKTTEASLQANFDAAVTETKRKSEAEILELEKRLERQIKQTDVRLQNVNARVQDISQIFNKIAVGNQALLNARERQLLILIAREIDPDNPIFAFNAAHTAFEFRRYEEALRYLDIVRQSEKSLPSDMVSRAQELEKLCKQYKENPPEVKTPPGGSAIGGYSILGLHVNTINTLVQNGLITHEQGKKILVESQVKQPEKKQ